MTTNEGEQLPKPGETLAQYVRRVRTGLSMSQGELAKKAGIHLQSIGKIELGRTARLSTKTTTGLSRALQIPQEYLDAVCKGVPVASVQQIKICPHCWVPGTEAEAMWLNPRSKYCFACGMRLSDRCVSCNEPILSLKFRFCPLCGVPYKSAEKLAKTPV